MAPAIAVTHQLPDDLVTESLGLETYVNRTQIRGQDSFTKANEALSLFQDLRRKIKAHFAAVKRPVNDAAKQIRSLEKAELAKIMPYEARLSAMILSWDDKQKAIREDAARESLADGGQTLVPAPPKFNKGSYILTTHSVVISDVALVIAELAAGRLPMSLVTDKVVTALQVELNRVLAKERPDLFAVPGCQITVKRTPVTK